MKRLVYLLVGATLIFTACKDDGEGGYDNDNVIVPWDGTSKKEPAKKTHEHEGKDYQVYVISEGSELAWFAEKINSGATETKGTSVYFTKDIDLGGKTWTPIGKVAAAVDQPRIKEADYMETPFFTGSIFGNGHTVSNVSTENVVVVARGLFGQVVGSVDDPSVIKGLHVKNVTINGDGKWSGGLVGFVRNVKEISGCSAEGVTIKSGTGKTSSETFACGALIGYISSNADIVIKNCTTKDIQLGEMCWNSSGFIGKMFGNTKVTVQDCVPADGYCRSFLHLDGKVTPDDQVEYKLAPDGWNNSWFIGNLYNHPSKHFELIIKNVKDNSQNWTELNSNGNNADITDKEKDAFFSWPYICTLDMYDQTPNALITVDGQTVFPAAE